METEKSRNPRPIYLFTEEEFDKAKQKDVLPSKCNFCNNVFYRTKKRIYLSRYESVTSGSFCSIKCANKYQRIGHLVLCNCSQCNKQFNRGLAEFNKSKNHFCSASCAATYNNTHKTKGTRVSKLEKWIHPQLQEKYKDFIFQFNDKSAIDSELDIYIPHLKLAVELNGIFHYKPIYGKEKLQQIKNNDIKKIQLCIDKNIKLYTINVSHINRFNVFEFQKQFEYICDIINKNLHPPRFEPRNP